MSAGAGLSETERQASGTAVYVYGVALQAPRLRSAGVVGADVEALTHDDLAAIVSRVPAKELRARRRDLLAHQEVLQEAFAAAPVVPLRFGTVFADADAVVAELLVARRDELRHLLQRFETLVELTVRAHYVEEAVLREIVRDDPRVARLRGRGSHDVALGEAVAAALDRKRAQESARIEQTLAPLAQEWAIEPPRTEYELFRGSFLVARRRVEAFDAAMDALARERKGSVVFKYVGPLPPHSFVHAEGLA